jgi:uncharacterized protein YhaN
VGGREATNPGPERRADLATRHQVLYFTCHPEQVQALRDANPSLTEIELQRLV